MHRILELFALIPPLVDQEARDLAYRLPQLQISRLFVGPGKRYGIEVLGNSLSFDLIEDPPSITVSVNGSKADEVYLDTSGNPALRSQPNGSIDFERYIKELLLGFDRAVNTIPPAIATPAMAMPAMATPAMATPAMATEKAGSLLPPIGEIFRTVGQPEHTLVEPAQLAELRVRLLNMGEGLVVEGPSGSGKTTLARAGLSEVPHDPPIWLSGTSDPHRRTLDEIISTNFARGGYLIIDDFHRLDRGRQGQVANLIKFVADMNRRDAKIILIGINPVGVSLVAHLPDLVGRFVSISMTRQPDEKIDELIDKGERAANIHFARRDLFVKGANGSFIIAQMLCYEAAVKSGVIRAEDPHRPPRQIDLTHKDVVDQVLRGLQDKFRPLLLSFASCDEQPPPRGACLALLWQLSRSDSASVTLTEVRYQYPQVRDAFDWLLKSNLAGNFESNPGLEQLLYYNRATGVLSIEDSRLEYYLRHLDWKDLARGSGHGNIFKRLNKKDGPVFFEPGTRNVTRYDAVLIQPAPPQDSVPWDLLHLSDLHFGTGEANASVWASQLLADLRELEVKNLQAIVVSGDVANISIRDEYLAASDFLRTVCGEIGLDTRRVVLVPGNHDLNWDLSRDAYVIHRKMSYKGDLVPGRYIDAGDYVEVPDEEKYRGRFEPFAAFYRALRQEDYSLDPKKQATLQYLPEAQALILGLNSSWEIDHHAQARASIHPEALSLSLMEVQKTETYQKSRIKIAVFHHPLVGEDEDRIKDAGFAERLAQAGFQLLLHGHIHKSQTGAFRYSVQQHMEVLGAGTFGTPRRAWVPGYPLQYQILRFSEDRLTVETRMRNEVNGAWKPDARWLQGPGQDPLPRYVVSLPPKVG